MALQPGQVSVRGLAMGRGTPYMVIGDINPFTLNVRAGQTADRAWNHGSWSGAEWADQKVIPMLIHAEADSGDAAGAMALLHPFNDAFRPAGDTAQDVEYRAHLGDREYLAYGRPRSSEPDLTMRYRGQFTVRAAFVATDPLIYSGDLLTTDAIALPTFVGGLSVPFTVPFTIESVRVGGGGDLANDGTAPSGISLRIDGPISEPFVAVQHPDGSVNTLRFHLDIPSGQFLLVNTAARTAFLQGLPQASRRGSVTADPDWPLAQPGTNTLRFGAGDDDTGTVTASWRSAWW